MSKVADSILASLEKHPLEALQQYEHNLHSRYADALSKRFGATMSLLRLAYDLDLERLPLRHAAARKQERRRLRLATVQRLLALHRDQTTLQKIADRFPRLVLEGTLQQQFCSKLAAEFKPDLKIPASVCDTVVVKLIEALHVVLRVGAPTTRDSAIEGLGALLRRVAPAEALPKAKLLTVERDKGEDRDEYVRRAKISKEYFARLERRRLMALTIAGEPEARTWFCERLQEPIADALRRIREEQRAFAELGAPLADPEKEVRRRRRHARIAARRIEDALYERADLLRILPAVARQRGNRPLPETPAKLLIEAAVPLDLDEDDSDDVRIAFARYQESLFRTLDVAMDRDWEWTNFDRIIAAAVHAIPQTIAGSPPVCNAQIRTTVAILRTGARVVKVSKGKSTATEPLAALFATLDDKVTKWANPGIAEGCYRAIPELAGEPAFNEMLRPALLELFEQMKHVPLPGDLLKTHRRLAANTCFRRVLVSITDHLYELQLKDSDTEATLDGEKVERDLRILLRWPTPENILKVCQRKPVDVPAHVPDDVNEVVVAGIAFESDLLRACPKLFREWATLATADKALLTRVLAAQLHALSRDLPELIRHPVLRRVFLGIPSISMSEAEAMEHLWKLLSMLPADAAQTADVEIQRFVEYRGGRSSGPDGRNPTDDLPGYVLAMIDPAASRRIAGGVAREIDLRRRQDYGREGADLARTLYQVTLRGPHESIFDHLLPRVIEPDARKVVLLFRRHVARVRCSYTNDGKLQVDEILAHVQGLLGDLRGHGGVLGELYLALIYFDALTTPDTEREWSVWDAIKNGYGAKVLKGLDDLAAATDREEDSPRKHLLPLYEHRMSDLEDKVEHYLELAVGKFDERIDALKKAEELAESMANDLSQQPGLQPPERFLLVALMQHFRDLFERTRRRFCEDPRQAMDQNDTAGFWIYFCDKRPIEQRMRELGKQAADAKLEEFWERTEAKQRWSALWNRARDEPPRFEHQAAKFEELFVEWRSSHLDVGTLKLRLKRRWSPWFRGLHGTVTSFTGISTVILFPGVWAAIAHLSGYHKHEGEGFFLEAFLMIVIAVVSLASAAHRITSGKQKKQPSDDSGHGHQFESLLPRLARLIAVPMALTVEFDHSYEFPMEGSTWALLLLIGLSYLSTRFFVTREIVDVREYPGRVETSEEERKRAAQIVALALAHSFGIAVLLSAIFASSFHHELTKHEGGHPDAAHSWIESVLSKVDKPSPPIHPYPMFLGVVPREVQLDLRDVTWLAKPFGEHAIFKFYPTIILTWTALGLFFGVFLEGFMGGKRLRGGGMKNESNADH